MTRDERVRAAARTLQGPRPASWVADETEVSTKIARKYLEQLVEDDVLRRLDHGGETLYCVDQLMASDREVASLQREHDREELTDALESMRADIVEWQATYDIESPGALRASIGDLEDSDEIETRRAVASEWEQLASRIPVVQATLAEDDWAANRDTPPA